MLPVLDKHQCKVPNILFPKTLEQYSDYKGSSWQDLEDYFNQMNLDYRVTGSKYLQSLNRITQ